MSVTKLLLLSFLSLASACAAVTHPARVSQGWSTSALVGYDQHTLEYYAGEFTNAGARFQLSTGYGHRMDDGTGLYGGLTLAVQADDDYTPGPPVMPNLVADLYYEFLPDTAGRVDAGVGVLLGGYPGVYALVGRELSTNTRVDAGVRALFGFDEAGDDDGPLRDVTPHAMLTLHGKGLGLGLYGEWGAYRRMREGELLDNGEIANSYVTGGFMVGLVLGFGY